MNNKCLKKTTFSQFEKLVEMMEQYPQLATCNPSFGCNRATLEKTWELVAEKVNALGPPLRNGQEWKKIWQDQKCRLKKKIGANNKSIHGTGGGPCEVINLTDLEQHIDKICHLSSAAAPSGKILGLPSSTPPRKYTQVAVVTPNHTKETPTLKDSNCDMNEIFKPNDTNITDITPTISSTIFKTSYWDIPTTSKRLTSTPKLIQNNRKRKRTDTDTHDSDKTKIIKQQVELQQKTIEIMEKQLQASIKNAEAACIQAEAAKIQAEASKIQAEASKAQTVCLQEIADYVKSMSQSLEQLLNHLKSDD